MGTNLGYYGPPLVVENDGLPNRPKGNMSNFKRNYGEEYKEEEGLGK